MDIKLHIKESKMKNKKITYYNNHLMYVNQDVIDILQKKTWRSRCKRYLTTVIISATFISIFISLVYCLYLTKTI